MKWSKTFNGSRRPASSRNLREGHAFFLPFSFLRFFSFSRPSFSHSEKEDGKEDGKEGVQKKRAKKKKINPLFLLILLLITLRATLFFALRKREKGRET